MTPKTATSAGAIILREIDRELKIALAQRRRPAKSWALPKGHVEAGETLEQAALREVQEEAGLARVQLLAYLGQVRREVLKDGARVLKTVHYYLAYALPSSQPEIPTEVDYDPPGWFTPADVLKLLPYEQEKVLLREQLSNLFASAPLMPVPLAEPQP
jgi:8-oxo-dGTP pyrophosphatase MutT (NUDIX family)